MVYEIPRVGHEESLLPQIRIARLWLVSFDHLWILMNLSMCAKHLSTSTTACKCFEIISCSLSQNLCGLADDFGGRSNT